MFCVLLTVDAPTLERWAWCSHRQIRAWAELHGYRVLVHAYNDSTWSIPRAMRWALDEHSHHCDSYLYLDSDLYVRPAWRPDLDTVDPRAAFQISTVAHAVDVNNGAFLFRNTPAVHAIAAWWASFGAGSCVERVSFPEQRCAQRIAARWRADVRVHVNASWNTQLNVFHAQDERGLRAEREACVASGALVCHALGIRFACKPMLGRLGATPEWRHGCDTRVHRTLFC